MYRRTWEDVASSTSSENMGGMNRVFLWIRRLYDWVLHWAETPYGGMALLGLAFCESSFFPVPPDVLLIALAISIPKRAFFYALLCAAGSVTGGMFGYLIGREFIEFIGFIRIIVFIKFVMFCWFYCYLGVN